MHKKGLNNIKIISFYFIDNIKDPYTIKTNNKSCLVLHVCNNEKKIFILRYLSKILKFSQSISFCFVAIIWNNDNNNIKFYLGDITQIYIEIALDFNLNFIIQILSKIISQLNSFFNFTIKVINCCIIN